MLIIILLAVLFVAVTIEAAIIVKTAKKEAKKERRHYPLNDADERNRRRETHYASNFWNYDGSEQEEFDE